MAYASRSHRSEVSIPQKLIALWGIFLLGTLFHTQLALMPLFHGLGVTLHEETAATMAEIIPILWLMLAFFMVPMVLMVATLFSDSRRFRTVHFGLTVLYSLLNLAHLIADLLVTPIAWYQIVLMGWLLVVGLVLNGVAYQWRKRAIGHYHPLQAT
ncbi:hypothetical protein C7271_17895 [filamentous cyanobacterium CCP5]|nr:hypothetical protein C7271_17895 [filamentous cyanobacterium CCP5]